MKPLVETPASHEEHHDLVSLLLANGIRYEEKGSSFLMPATIWVEDADRVKALEIAASVSARHGKQRKANWEREWNERYKGSYVRWLFANIYKQGNLFRLLLLLIVIGVLVIYPLGYIIRRL